MKMKGNKHIFGFKNFRSILGALSRKDWTRLMQLIRGTWLGHIVGSRHLAGIREFTKKHFKPDNYPPLPLLNLIKPDNKINISELVFPTPKTVDVSIIIPTYGNLPYTAACLKSIANNLPHAAIEIIVIEDCSGDKEIEVLKDVPGLIYRKNDQNLGFLRSCNLGASCARGEYIFLLNNDTQVTSGWLDALLEVFVHKPDAGLVGSKLLYPDGHLQEAGGIIWNDGRGHNYGVMDNPALPQYNYLKQVDYISGAAIMIPRQLWNALGGFDEYFTPAYCEDSDFCFRARAMGKQAYFQPTSVVIHFEGISHGKKTNKNIKKYQIINQRKLFDRWQNVLQKEHHPPGQEIFFARDRSKFFQYNLLIIETEVPRTDNDAGSKTIFDIIKILLNKNCNIKFWPATLNFDPIYTPKLQQEGIEVFYSSYMNFSKWIEENGKYIDVALVCRPDFAKKHIESIKNHSQAAILYYGHDIHHLRIQQQLHLERESDLLKENFLRMREIEQDIWSQVDTIIYPSEEETAYTFSFLQTNGHAAKSVTIPAWFYPYAPYIHTQNPSNRRDILFVAGFSHTPNVDAACWLAQNILPLVRDKLPEIQLHLVGNNPTHKVESLACEYIHVTGRVSETVLAYYYSHCRIAVSPLRFGAGVKRKVVESMYHGLPVITTSVGIQGLTEASHFLPYADDEKMIAEKIIHLLRDDAYWQDISRKSVDFVNRNYSIEAMTSAVISLLPPLKGNLKE